MCSSQERSNWCNYMLKCHLRLGIENLPCELQRNFTLMRDLDNRTEGDHLNHVYQFFYLHVGFQDLPKLATCCCMIVSWIMIVGLLLRFQVTHPRSARNWMAKIVLKWCKKNIQILSPPRKEGRDQQVGRGVRSQGEKLGVRAASGASAENPKRLQQVQRVQRRQGAAGHADLRDGWSQTR